MRSKIWGFSGRITPLMVGMLLGQVFPCAAQGTVNPDIPFVTIRALDPVGMESGKPAIFEVDRHGSTNYNLLVYYTIGGTASNGVDYKALSQWVTVPPGSNSAPIVVQPIPDSSIETQEEGTKTVILQLSPSPLMIPVNFSIGYPSNATAYILDDDAGTNLPPIVRIDSPANRSVFREGIDIPIIAFATDLDGRILSVEFLAGTNSLGFGDPLPCITPQYVCPTCPVPVCPTNRFILVWTNVPVGAYDLRAVATDNGGAVSVSDPVHITVLPSPPPPTNRPPIVSIVATDPIAIEGTNCWVWWGLTNESPTWANWSVAACRPITACGPKDAVFAVRRCGETNGDLTVTYDIGGTATNGVDYVGLPGLVTIPAGERAALVTIVPIDDGPPDLNSTVILRLTPPATTPPGYIIGEPGKAAALIIDSRWPWPASAVLADRCFHLRATGPDGAWFRVECSSNLIDWQAVCTNQVISGSVDFVDPDASVNATRFYRVVPEMNAP
jgi:Bacterial Ig domain/Calx-beta domain